MNATTEPKTLSLTDDERAQMLHAARTSLDLYGAESITATANMLRRKGQDARVYGRKSEAKRFLDMASIWRYVSTEGATR